MSPYFELPPWFQKVFKGLLIEVFILLTLGATVRVLNAGLACPDWPLCFGDVIPDFHPQVYLEFIHRVLAGVIAVVTTVLVVILCRRKNVPKSVKVLGLLSIFLLIAQVVLGGLTVLLRLDSKVVAAHLTMGTALYGILLWMYLTLRYAGFQPVSEEDRQFKPIAIGALLAICTQIILGGLVASHYAALVCTDFPLCFGKWFPTFSGIIGLNVIHRTFAYIVVLVVIVNWWLLRKYVEDIQIKKTANWLLFFVFVQFAIGVSNVVFHTPPLLAVLHLTAASALLGLATANVRRITQRA